MGCWMLIKCFAFNKLLLLLKVYYVFAVGVARFSESALSTPCTHKKRTKVFQQLRSFQQSTTRKNSTCKRAVGV